jgi:MoaA/NifB/PqqE/SkfB family radical SAM enzyme
MGFPKPWPTPWPDPQPEEPTDPNNPTDPTVRNDLAFHAVTWAVNHACNLRCTHCYDAVEDKRHDLSTADALSVVDRLGEAGVDFVAFSGGELFLRKDLFSLIERCVERGIAFGARSNGTRVTKEIASRLASLGAAVVGVSFDGATSSVHDATRGSGAFAAAVRGVEALVAAGVRTQIEVVLSRANSAQAVEFIQFGDDLGAAEVNFSAMTPIGRGAQRTEDLLDRSLWTGLVQRLRDASVHAPMRVTPNCAFAGDCAANVEPHITCDGWITPCYLSAERLFNVLDTPPSDFRALLARSRPRYLDVCGRAQWQQDRPPTRLIQLTRRVGHVA